VVVLLAAMVLMLASPLWTATQKLLGAVVAPLLLAVPVFGSVVAVRVEYDAAPAGPNWAAIGLIAMLLAGLVIEGLIWRSGARRAAELERQAATTQR
jgi:hypothetical protein